MRGDTTIVEATTNLVQGATPQDGFTPPSETQSRAPSW